MTTDTIRPTKKQYELLSFIERFIVEHGYSPSYREVMNGCGYNSVATVATHISSLLARGHLRKRDRSARSLEVVGKVESPKLGINQLKEAEEKWLVQRVEYMLKDIEASMPITQNQIDELYVLVGALKILGVEGAAQSFLPRLKQLKA